LAGRHRFSAWSPSAGRAPPPRRGRTSPTTSSPATSTRGPPPPAPQLPAQPGAAQAGHHTYDWAFDDHIAGALATAGLRWLPVLDYTAPWDQSIRGQDHSPPRSDSD